MKVHPLPVEAGAGLFLAEITYADLTATGNTQTLAPFAVADKVGFEIVDVKLVEPFVSSDGTLVSTSITIGDGGSATRFLSATELNQAGTEVFLKGGTLANTSLPYVYAADDTVDVFFTATSAKALNTHTAGKLLVTARITDARPSQVL